ncbi:outer membrane lipoprotein chaperone LolA [Neptunomonas sp. XY-337]|uniref:outer membrane lipoprotein chaperone LolA n=1 Tax=Neptunomonas sp. XY-337 TaxID=2561897 RepID=UPI0010AA1F7F|nr:outer membrane lipoprotein chaperone LolA [Neptunomonas sp. XY-337]
MKRFKQVVISSVLVCMPVFALAAGKAADQLDKLLGDYSHFSAEFEQVTRSNDNLAVAVSQGEVSVSRPGKFRWITSTPYPQTIVSDGTYVWIYDPDLEQATRKPFSVAGNNGAAHILNGDVAALAKEYDISLILNNDSEQLFQLLPRSDEGNFQSIRLFFVDGVMSELLLIDLLGQKTTVMFNNVEVNAALSEALFQFAAPEGVDVIISDTP